MRTRAFLPIIYLIYILLLFEITARVYWTLKKNIPFFSTEDIIYLSYPELRSVKQKQIQKNDGYFDILFLGGSTMNQIYTTTKEVFSRKIPDKAKKIRFHDLSRAGGVSLGSYVKYRMLSDKYFDLIIIYHGINDLLLNNFPASVFENDYSHYHFSKISALQRHSEINFLVLPFTIENIYYEIKDILSIYRYLPMHLPINELGSEIKTAGPFKDNMTKIIETANKKGESLLLMTYAYYIPPGYTLEKFKNKTLDYEEHSMKIEYWGTPENVRSGISVHNKIIEDLYRKYKGNNVSFVDMNRLIPKQGQYFFDVCHFNRKGCRKAVDNIIDSIIGEMNRGY